MPKLTEARKRANRKYLAKFKYARIQMTDERLEAVKAHASAQGESLASFTNRAIDETIERDNAKAKEANK